MDGQIKCAYGVRYITRDRAIEGKGRSHISAKAGWCPSVAYGSLKRHKFRTTTRRAELRQGREEFSFFPRGLTKPFYFVFIICGWLTLVLCGYWTNQPVPHRGEPIGSVPLLASHNRHAFYHIMYMCRGVGLGFYWGQQQTPKSSNQ